ncbi:MFS transporter [Frankia sp. QA3]|uniref:MFS transporter n=1 Tax=Frankia sp. QA3 TaxID=710111 RepID=UPI000269CF6A|nr:MFS transporter [Frankia sp. QA3]EIV96335.1 arabinose efflux permease family protein [Frankia sp. QA3]
MTASGSATETQPAATPGTGADLPTGTAAAATATTTDLPDTSPHPMPTAGPASHHTRVLLVTCGALATVISAMSSLNVALPSIAADTHASQTRLSWIIDAYSLVFAALLLPAGALGDRFGRRRALLAGLVIFGAGSATAPFTSSAAALIGLRCVLGVGAALVMPATLSTITGTFPRGRRAAAVGVWAAVAGASAVVGLLVSGLLLQAWSWRSVFLLGVVLAALAAVGTWLFVPDSAAPDGPPLDPRLFTRPAFAAGTVSILLQFFGFFGLIFVTMQYLQLVRGDSALVAALSVLPMAAGMMPAARLAPKVAAAVGTRACCVAGLVLVTAGMVVLSRLDQDSTYWLLLAGLFPLGVGMGLAMTPATTAVTDSLPPALQGVGSAVNDLSRELGGALGIAVLGSLLSSTYRSHLALPASLPPALADKARSSLGVAAHLGEPISATPGRRSSTACRSPSSAARSPPPWPPVPWPSCCAPLARRRPPRPTWAWAPASSRPHPGRCRRPRPPQPRPDRPEAVTGPRTPARHVRARGGGRDGGVPARDSRALRVGQWF